MKRIQSILLAGLLVSATLLFSCSKEDETSFSFKDQNLQGKIDGLPFNFGEGMVEDEDDTFLVSLFHEDESLSACEIGLEEYVSAFFMVPKEVGIYKLYFNLSNFDGQVVTLFNPDGFQNNIATIGAIEILTITEGGITGRMDARMDSQNRINGNFSANFCVF
jgi:hypothetical protein